MNYNIETYNPNQLAKVKVPSADVLEYLKEEGIRELINNHYELLKLSGIKDMFPQTDKGFEMAKKHSADFFIQLMGGPKFFTETRGNPMMRRRHDPFEITPEARIIWLECYIEALEKTNAPDTIKQSYWDYVNTFSTWMINTQSKIE